MPCELLHSVQGGTSQGIDAWGVMPDGQTVLAAVGIL
jgi:hypothetical protein